MIDVDYFFAIWSTLCTATSHLYFMAISYTYTLLSFWHIISFLVCCIKKNLATLVGLAPEISFQKFEKIFFSVGCSVAHSGRT
jgi:hypothetical protein